jgi:putative membrane protein
MRRYSLRLLTVLGVAASLAACGDQRTEEFERETEETRTLDPSLGTEGGIGTSGTQADMDPSFAHFAARSNRAEIELGRLGQEKAQSQAVRDYASQIAEDHMKAQQELRKMASVPEEPELDAMHRQTYDRLSQLSGEEFDREFMRVMVDGHRRTIERFEQEAEAPGTGVRGTTGQPLEPGEDLSHFAEQTLPTLRSHLERAQQVQEQVGQGQAR